MLTSSVQEGLTACCTFWPRHLPGPIDRCRPSGCAGCQHALHCKADGCYVSMVYHLVQTCDAPLVIRDQAWYLKHLRHIMDRSFETDTARAFFLFDSK